MGCSLLVITLLVFFSNSSQGEQSLVRPAFESFELSAHDLKQVQQAALQAISDDLGIDLTACHVVEDPTRELLEPVAMDIGEDLLVSSMSVVSMVCDDQDLQNKELVKASYLE